MRRCNGWLRLSAGAVGLFRQTWGNTKKSCRDITQQDFRLFIGSVRLLQAQGKTGCE